LETEEVKALELYLTGCEVLMILPIGYGKSYIYEVFCLANVFALSLNARMLVISLLNTRSTALLNNNSRNDTIMQINHSLNMHYLTLAVLSSI